MTMKIARAIFALLLCNLEKLQADKPTCPPELYKVLKPANPDVKELEDIFITKYTHRFNPNLCSELGAQPLYPINDETLDIYDRIMECKLSYYLEPRFFLRKCAFNYSHPQKIKSPSSNAFDQHDRLQIFSKMQRHPDVSKRIVCYFPTWGWKPSKMDNVPVPREWQLHLYQSFQAQISSCNLSRIWGRQASLRAWLRKNDLSSQLPRYWLLTTV